MWSKGQVITAYHAGYWRITRIIRRYYDESDARRGYGVLGEEYSPLLQYEKVMNEAFKLAGTPTLKECDALYCKVVDIDELRLEAEADFNARLEGLERLRNLL